MRRTALVKRIARWCRKLHMQTALRKQRMPERIVFEQVQHTGDANGYPGVVGICSFTHGIITVKQQRILQRRDTDAFALGFTTV